MEACTNTPRNTRIAVFYDGSYFCNVSDYYRLWHNRAAQLCYNGLHQFVKSKVAQMENTEAGNCTIVDAHYFRGRFSVADSARNASSLLRDRIHDEALMEANITTHFLPMQHKGGGEEGHIEKGIDVWFALEAYELTLLKKYDVVVLITGDADHLPLIRKLTALNSRVMLLYWNINVPSRTDIKGASTSKIIVKAATYPVNMIEEINQRNGNPVIENMFILNKEHIAKQKPANNKKNEEKKNQEVKPRENGISVNEVLRSQIFTVSKSIENAKTQTTGYIVDLSATELRPPRKRTVQHQKIIYTSEQNVKSPASIETPSAKIKEVQTKPVETRKEEVNTNVASLGITALITENLEQNIAASHALGNKANAIMNSTALCLYNATCTALIHIPYAAAVTIEAPPIKKRLKNLSGRQKGVITWIDYHRGIGKVDISSDYPSITFYCNANSIHKFKGLKKNNLVEFDLKKSPNGTFAINLKSAAA